MNAHQITVIALANGADPAEPDSIVGSALELAIGEAEALTDENESLIAYALRARLEALSHFISRTMVLSWQPTYEPLAKDTEAAE